MISSNIKNTVRDNNFFMSMLQKSSIRNVNVDEDPWFLEYTIQKILKENNESS